MKRNAKERKGNLSLHGTYQYFLIVSISGRTIDLVNYKPLKLLRWFKWALRDAVVYYQIIDYLLIDCMSLHLALCLNLCCLLRNYDKIVATSVNEPSNSFLAQNSSR